VHVSESVKLHVTRKASRGPYLSIRSIYDTSVPSDILFYNLEHNTRQTDRDDIITCTSEEGLNPVEFYLYPTVGTVLIHSVKPELTE